MTSTKAAPSGLSVGVEGPNAPSVERVMVPIAEHKAALEREREHGLAMHFAFRPEVVAEIAVHLGSHENWDTIAEWCGGLIGSTQDPSGEYSSFITLPGGQTASEQSWITLDHEGTFRVRDILIGPETPAPPGSSVGPGQASPARSAEKP